MMKIISSVKVLRIALSLILLLSLTITPAFAKPKDVKEDSKKDQTVEPKVVYDGGFWFNPTAAEPGQTIYAEGDQSLYSIYLADAYFEMMLDARFKQPSIKEREGLPSKSFTYSYHEDWGGSKCWVYDSGVQWYDGHYYMYLKASTKTDSSGTLNGMQGSSAYMPDLWYRDSVDVE